MVNSLSGMAVREFLPEEVMAVAERYPRLLSTVVGTMEGVFDISAEYEGSLVTDSFTVKITASNPNSELLPAVYETGGRTERIAKQHGITDLRDLHRNPDGTACLCTKLVERRKCPPGTTLLNFIEVLVVPYFYSLSYYQKHGRFPWADFSHGGIGLLEFAADDTEQPSKEDMLEILKVFRCEPSWKAYYKQLRKPSAERACLCGSLKQFSRCHSRAWSGIARLRAEVQRFNLDSKKLFRPQ